MFIFLWILMGLFGSAMILWATMRVECPSPLMILFALVWACTGFIAALVGVFILLVMLACWLEEKAWFQRFCKWMVSPICKRKDGSQ
jgi:hypothetical protein